MRAFPTKENMRSLIGLEKSTGATESQLKLSKKLLQEITHRPLFAKAAKDNIGSIRVLQKCDFKIIGENKDFAQGRGEEIEEYIFRLDGEIQ